MKHKLGFVCREKYKRNCKVISSMLSENKKISEIAEHLNVSVPTVNRMRKYCGQGVRSYRKTIPEEFLAVCDKMTGPQLAEKFDMNLRTVQNWKRAIKKGKS